MDGHQQQKQQRVGGSRNWPTRLEDVLTDFDALQQFQSWMGVDDDSSEHPLRLHFAIVAFRQMQSRADPRAALLAREIYNKFLRPRSGLCAFIEASIRERVAQRLRQQSGGGSVPPADLFNECQAPVELFLRKQHAIFVSSHEFLDFFNSSLAALSLGEGSAAALPSSSSPAARRPTLTADTLMRSQKEREAMVPAGGASQRLFKPVAKLPYVGGQAQPSKNDSAVSSAFSSEANRAPGGSGASHSLRLIREEQRKANNQQPPPALTAAAFPPPQRLLLDHGMAIRECGGGGGQFHSGAQFSHETGEGRREFAELLQRKLQAVLVRHRQEESVKEQIERIRQRGTNVTARELIITGAADDSALLLQEEEDSAIDADAELEKYCDQRLRMVDSSSANSAQQSPPQQQQPMANGGSSRRVRRKSRDSCSPSGGRDWPPAAMMAVSSAAPFVEAGPGPGDMSRSCCSANPCTSFSARLGRADFVAIAHQFESPFPLLDHTERFFPPFPSMGQQPPPPYSPAPFGGQGQQLAMSSAGIVPPPNTGQTASVGLSQSLYLATGTRMMATAGGQQQQSSAPGQPKPPFLTPKAAQSAARPLYCDNDGDTSGIGSMTSATHSGTSAPGTADFTRQRAAVFRKARELSSGGGGERSALPQPQGGGQQQQQSAGKRRQPPHSAVDQQQQSPLGGGGSLPRPRPGPAGGTQPLQQAVLPSPLLSQPRMTICYRDSSAGGTGDGVPVVAHVPLRPITFREFRRLLSISSKDRRQFFFKTACEDGSAPYQLLLVNDDHALVPMFEGKVSAECRAPLSDSD